ncbi:MAG TPA: putative zinc-binding protein [Syntrophorhabdaceae bacterium]|nr:putative zinc-binding protein [Syntrophorhabdaceae bacterium]
MLQEKDICCSGPKKMLILACAGGSNVGQISNSLMIELDKRGVGNAYCLAGIGGDLSGFVETAKAADLIVIDGCPAGCAKNVLKRHGITPNNYYIVTQLGIEKNHNFDRIIEETEKVLTKILTA